MANGSATAQGSEAIGFRQCFLLRRGPRERGGASTGNTVGRGSDGGESHSANDFAKQSLVSTPCTRSSEII